MSAPKRPPDAEDLIFFMLLESSDAERDLLLMLRDNGFDLNDAAEQLGASRTAVDLRLHKIRRKWKDRVGR